MTIQPGAQLYTLGFGVRPEGVEVPHIEARAPSASDVNYPLGKPWLDSAARQMYWLSGFTSVGGVLQAVWSSGGNAAAGVGVQGIVSLSTLGQLSTGTAPAGPVVPLANDVFTFVNSVVIAGGNLSTESAVGLIQEATDAQAVAGTNLNPATPLAVQPKNLAPVFASPPAIGGTAPAAAAFTTLGASGLASLSGSATILSAGTAINIGSDASADAINLGTGAAARTIILGNSTGATSIALNVGTGALNLGTNAIAHTVTLGNITGATAVNINTGTGGSAITTTNGTFTLATGTGAINVGTDAVAKTLTLGNVTGATAVNINTGTGGSTYTTTNGTFTLATGTGGINIGTDAAAKVITLGNSTGATSIVLNNGTGALNLGTNAIAHTVTIGNVTGATAVNINVGTGNFDLEGATTSTYTISGTGVNTGTITIGGGTGAQTLNVMSSTGGKTVNIANGAGANLVTIGSVTGASSMSLLVGTGNFSLDGAATSTYTFAPSVTSGTINFGGTGANTGTATILGGTGAQTINVAASTGVKTLNIGTGAAANVITLGTTNTTASLNLQSGSGNVSVTGGHLSIASVARTLLVNGGAVTDFIGTGTLTNGAVTIANTNIATGDVIILTRTAANASTTLGVFSYTISNATSFTVTSLILGTPGSTQTGDLSSFAYFIVRPT